MKGAIVGLVLLIAVALAGIVIAGPFEDGVAAYEKGQFATAFKLWLPLAEQGHADAQFNVAVLYEKGSGVVQDYVEAARWYLEAARQGETEAQYNVGLLYETGTGLTQDLKEAAKWYTRLIANPRQDAASLASKQRARQRLANLARATEEIVAYEGGRFVIARAQDGACVIALQGLITRDASRKFDDVVTKSTKIGCSKPLLLLESPGGLLVDGLSLGKELRVQGFQTVTRYECASACALIFLGGTERVLVGSRAKIGLHQAASVRERGGGNERWCSSSMDSNGVRDTRRYLRWAIPATADQVMELIMRTSCNAIDWTYGQRALDLGIATRLESEGVDVVGPKELKQ